MANNTIWLKAEKTIWKKNEKQTMVNNDLMSTNMAHIEYHIKTADDYLCASVKDEKFPVVTLPEQMVRRTLLLAIIKK